ncbi:DsbE family thiol:disulfide interchange protein [Psychromonas antarctica]|jgi:cytochrome c biogenesis protein CcmG/thiol:disulfide interchange protein DsbE|uniref:DsbE family thiol:disulfide interchange protein n=1 Tax=Psychromonas antarctica TaxID=67573 RepID=UPI001EE8E985|nr:DsbE family thiol:disulfide interchange protein [Psychromonas antarctica]MCG6199811.1 DsbE family thiol:disulfide interchange protein [Psychromonas antarctica]
MANTRKKLFLSAPLVIFVIGIYFLAAPLFKGTDPRKLDSALVGQRVPSFTLQDLYNHEKQYDAAIFKGQKMLLNVWATWCPTCYAEHHFLNELAEQGVYIIGMNYKDERSKAIKWLTDLQDPYQISLFDKNGMLGLDLGVYGAPETYLIDSKGIIRYRHVGDLNKNNWQDTVLPRFNEME